MTVQTRTLAAVGSVAGFLGVALGAFGAHALRSRLEPGLLETFEVGVRYEMYHALAILAAAWAFDRTGLRLHAVAGWCFAAGIALFSGSLYVLALTGERWWGAITPVGGLAFLAGWTMLGVGWWRSTR